MDSLISIIVPIYNAEKYLHQCIESILSQTYKNLEIILINDGSTDNSLNICNYYKSIDSRIIVIDKPNEGVSATRNLGIRIAKGDYIGFVDADDYIEKNMFEVLLTKIKNDKSQLCAMTLYIVNNYGKGKFIYKNNNMISGNEALKQLLLLKFPTSVWAYLYSKKVIKKNYFNEEIHFFEDFEFNYRILSTIDKVSICDLKLYNYRTHGNSTNSQKINDRRITCLKICDSIKKDLENKGRDIVKIAVYFRAHLLISVIASLSKSKNADDKYFKIVCKKSRDIIWDIIFSNYVPLRYKILILVFSINPKFFSKIIKLIKYRKQN